MTSLQQTFTSSKLNGQKQLAVLIDPDKIEGAKLDRLADNINHSKVDLVFVGGSLLLHDNFDTTIQQLKQLVDCPVIIFPGHPMQISKHADALLLLSLISGRNAELLIGQHVHAAPLLKKSGLTILPTGYILVDGQQPTSVSYISNTQPIPANKPDIAVCTALAGEMLGLQNIYLEAGSGAIQPVPIDMVAAVSQATSIPLLVGGGIRSPKMAHQIGKAGADIIVVGSAIEKDIHLIEEMAAAIHSSNRSS